MDNQRNILFVSKYQFVLDETIEKLRAKGYAVAGADSIEDVKDILRNSFYHLVITDYTIGESEKSMIKNTIPEFDDETKYYEHYGDVDSLEFELGVLIND